MAKRFTDTDKWDRPWFRRLPGAYKLLWLHILDKCDMSGVWYVDFELASFMVGELLTEAVAVAHFEKQIRVLPGGSRWFIEDFVLFQYGELRDNNKCHVGVIRKLKLNGIESSGMVGNRTPLTNNVKGPRLDDLFDVAKGTCSYCLRKIDRTEMEVDHVHPLSRGGTNDPTNLVAACGPCNRGKGNLTVDEFCQKAGLDSMVVISRLVSRGFKAPSIFPDGAKEKDKDKDKEKDKEKPLQPRNRKPSGLEYSPDFLKFWAVYPNPAGKFKAFESWQKIAPSAELVARIVRAVEIYRTTPDWVRDDGQFIPHAVTWLNQRRWDDDVKPGKHAKDPSKPPCQKKCGITSSWGEVRSMDGKLMICRTCREREEVEAEAIQPAESEFK